MSLYSLAPELLAQILRFTDPSTFYILSRFVAPFLAEATASSKSLLLYQLGALPGLKHGLEDLTIQELFSCFQQRAAESLCGVDVLAEISLFTFGFPSLDVRQSMFFPQFKGADCLFMVHNHEPCVSIFAISPTDLLPRFRMVVDLRERYESEEPCKMKILRIAVSPSGGRWAILYSHESIMAEIPTAFVKERSGVRDAQASSQQSFKLAILNQDSDMYHLTLDDKKLELSDFHRLGGLAISNGGYVAICGIFTSRGKVCSKVRAYRQRYDSKEPGSMSGEGRREIPAKLTLTSAHFSDLYKDEVPIYDVKFTSDGSQLLFFSPTSPIHHAYLECEEDGCEHEPTGLNRSFVSEFSLDGEAGDERDMRIGMPFYSSHTMGEGGEGRACMVVWLSIGTSVNSAEDAYIVRSTLSRPSDYCDCELDLDIGRRQYEWDVLVRLKGFLRSSSSLGPVIAISRDSRRLAVADWKDIRIWPLDPDGLMQNEDIHYRHANRQSDSEISSGIGSIEPFELPTNGDVIHRLYFVSSEFLYAVTDHGVTLWDLRNETSDQLMSYS